MLKHFKVPEQKVFFFETRQQYAHCVAVCHIEIWKRNARHVLFFLLFLLLSVIVWLIQSEEFHKDHLTFHFISSCVFLSGKKRVGRG